MRSIYELNGISFGEVPLHRTGYITENEMFALSMLNNILEGNVEVYFRNVNLIGIDEGANISLMVFNETHDSNTADDINKELFIGRKFIRI